MFMWGPLLFFPVQQFIKKNCISFKRGDVQIWKFHLYACHKKRKKECSLLPKLRHLLLSAVCWRNNWWVPACKLQLAYTTALRIFIMPSLSSTRKQSLPQNKAILSGKKASSHMWTIGLKGVRVSNARLRHFFSEATGYSQRWFDSDSSQCKNRTCAT